MRVRSLALAAFEVAVVEGVEGVFDLLGEGFGLRVSGGLLGWRVFEGSGEEDAALLVGCGVEGVGSGAGAWARDFEERRRRGACRTTRGVCMRVSAARVRAGSCSGRTRARRRTRSISLAGSAVWARTLSMRVAAACLSSWRRMAESMPSFCAASAANSSRWMRLGMRRMWGRRKLRALTLASAVRAGKSWRARSMR